MTGALAIASWWGHVAAALAGAMLLHWTLRNATDAVRPALAATAVAVAGWGMAVALTGARGLAGELSEGARNLALIWLMLSCWRRGGEDAENGAIRALHAVLALVTGAMMAAMAINGPGDSASAAVVATMRAMVAAGALVLVHNLFIAADRPAAGAVRWPLGILAAIWAYDLNLYAAQVLTATDPAMLTALRGVVVAGLTGLMAVKLRRGRLDRIQMSRGVVFQSFSILVILTYLAVMIVAGRLFELVGGDSARIAQVALALGAGAAIVALMTSGQLRAWFDLRVAKHFFKHRYDYRAEWLRFTDTLGRPGEAAAPLPERIVKAVADVAGSPGGYLLLVAGNETLEPSAAWQWSQEPPPVNAGSARLIQFLCDTAAVVDLDRARAEDAGADAIAALLPEWLIGLGDAWALVPLTHFGRLAGAVILERPRVARTLDWEDFDLLRVAGGQVASYLAEARSQQELAEARRFDEFNRRFAFIMHDIKNLVSQLSLVARNAERHADNPEFRADMIATLQSSVMRMNDLLARLSQHNKLRPQPPRPIPLTPVIERVAAVRRAAHPVVILSEGDIHALADPARLEQAVSHLVQNAIEASPAGEPVCIHLRDLDDTAAIEVVDRGAGMSADFIRDELFKPFASTKPGGFGIGAYEARDLVVAMGGQLNVQSAPGSGSRFSVLLPLTLAAAEDSPKFPAMQDA